MQQRHWQPRIIAPLKLRERSGFSADKFLLITSSLGTAVDRRQTSAQENRLVDGSLIHDGSGSMSDYCQKSRVAEEIARDSPLFDYEESSWAALGGGGVKEMEK